MSDLSGIKNIYTYLGNGKFETINIAFKNGKFSYLGNEDLALNEILKSTENLIALPGFIDQHTHGGGGSDCMDGTEADLKIIASTLAKEGTTAFLATTMTMDSDKICSALSTVKEHIEAHSDEGAEILGVHLEGPFINEKYAGAQPASQILTPDVDKFIEFNNASGNNIKLVTLAPEKQGADDLISYLKSNKIVASIGHSNAKFSEVVTATKLGASNVTHTYNAQSPLHHRDIGVVGASFMLDELASEVIADTIHVSKEALHLLIKNKPAEKVVLITDSMRAKGITSDISELGGQTVYIKNGEARLSDGTLAGSILKMNVAIKNLVTKVNIPFATAVDFASINPAKNLGVDSQMGSIELGKKANLAIVNKDFEVVMTIREGKVIYIKD